ncbi:MAG: DUF885 family protein [Deltaproteobacteria bacterium]|nr:MAG: DUF885 family protein [Deltaproteobacteria bacterium]
MKSKRTIEERGRSLFATLTETFPLCCGSDEFPSFPHVPPDPGRSSFWDDFSHERVEDVLKYLRGVEDVLEREGEGDIPEEERVDREVLTGLIRNLRFFLEHLRPHRRQPTFHLTLLTTGILEVLGRGGGEERHIPQVGEFLERARRALDDVSPSYKNSGISMAEDIFRWVSGEDIPAGIKASVLPPLEEFRDFLSRVPTGEGPPLNPELYPRLIQECLGEEISPHEVQEVMREEMEETAGIMRRTSGGGAEGISTCLPEEGVVSLFRREVNSLREHCLEKGLFPEGVPTETPLQVVMVPPYLMGIRAGSAYAFSPQGDKAGGIFYIHPGDSGGGGNTPFISEYSMLSAHETYPGHHLLDVSRWSNPGLIRRHVESPLFYEGWACFAENILRETGYYANPTEQFLLARRRYRRAVRGLVDVRVNTGMWTVDEASEFLARSGFPPESARSIVEKYLLRPGSQIIYTLGFRFFRDLFRKYGEGRPEVFARLVLSAGEIPFSCLEEVLARRENN